MALPPVPENLENIVVVREFLARLREAVELGIESDPVFLSQKGQPGGVPVLDGSTLIPTSELGTGVADSTKVLKGDRTWGTAGGGGGGDIKSDGTVPFAADESMGNFKLTNVGAPTLAGDATNKTYVDAQEALDLRLNGSRPMTGALNMNTHLINNVVDPVSAQDAATKNYVDTNERWAPDRIVDPSGHGTDTTLASALTALAGTGGTIYVKAGTYNITTTHTLPLKNISIIGAGGNTVGPNVDLDATTFNLGSNAIALFTTPTGGGGTIFASYYFAGFKVIGNAAASQQFFTVPVSALGCAAVAERVHVEDVTDIVKTQGQDVDFTFRDCVLDPKTTSAKFWNATGAGGELTWEHVQGNLPSGTFTVISGGPSFNVAYSYIGGPPASLYTINVQDINWVAFFLGANAEAFTVNVGAAISTIASCHFQLVTINVNTTLFFCTNSWFSGSNNGGSPQLTLNGVAGMGKMNISNCLFDASGASATRGIDVVNVSDIDISGCGFLSHSSEGIRATGSSTLAVTGCRFTETVPVNETASTVVGRYTGNTGFTSSVIAGPDSVVEGVRRKDVVGGTTTDPFVTQFTHVNAKGLTGCGSIKNTGGSNTMTVRITATDVYGTTDTALFDVVPGASAAWSMADPVGTSLPPFVSYAVAVQSTSAGNSTTFTLHHATAGAY